MLNHGSSFYVDFNAVFFLILFPAAVRVPYKCEKINRIYKNKKKRTL